MWFTDSWKLILTVLEAGRFKTKALAGLVSGKDLPPDPCADIFVQIHTAEGKR